MSGRSNRNEQQAETVQSLSRITVSGFKSISKERSIEVRPLTILAGANSSGKSSIVQPLLLLKQTLDSPFDPGPLKLGGPNVEFTAVEQMLARGISSFQVAIRTDADDFISLCFGYSEDKKLRLLETRFGDKVLKMILRPEMTHEEIISHSKRARRLHGVIKQLNKTENEAGDNSTTDSIWSVGRERCFLFAQLDQLGASDYVNPNSLFPLGRSLQLSPDRVFGKYLRDIIHVPGLRGNPVRTYPVTAVGTSFPGPFQSYVASVIAKWQEEGNSTLNELAKDMALLQLTSAVAARRLNDAEVELQVGRFFSASKRNGDDMVSIADVGLGVSQALPVLVALRAANRGQLVYIEQPEIHLHPAAQWLMARTFAEAAKRGVRIIVETHSALFLLGVQTLVAERILSPDLVKLHWFRRNGLSTGTGNTQIKSANVDETGAFGDWPQDFADVSLKAEVKFLDAAQRRALAS